MKSRLVILDANVIIKAFEYSFWNDLISGYDIHIPSIVLRVEVTHYRDQNNLRIDIDLLQYLNKKQIKELEASPSEINALENMVTEQFLQTIDDGEREAIAVLKTGNYDDFQFCTFDMRAVKALSALSLGSLGISLEELLDGIGQKKKFSHPSCSKNLIYSLFGALILDTLANDFFHHSLLLGLVVRYWHILCLMLQIFFWKNPFIGKFLT